MLPLGRRRAGSLTPLTLFLGLILLFASTASAAVLGIDFGTLNIKAALVKPGAPLDIVLTKDSKRKEVAAVAFKPNRDEKNKIVTEEGTFPERSYGGDALSLQGRLPGEVFPNL
jgi:hypoxia up-regulated 1